MNVCSVEGCKRTGKMRRKMCSMHYQRWQKYGDPHGGNPKYSDPDDAVKNRVKRVGECLIWTGHTNPRGYPRMNVGGRLIMVYRYVWERSYGPVPEDREINHRCFNRACINLEHLELMTRSQNTPYRRGAQPNSKTGIRNVHQKGDGWAVRLKVKQCNMWWGPFETVEEAKAEASRRRLEFFGIP